MAEHSCMASAGPRGLHRMGRSSRACDVLARLRRPWCRAASRSSRGWRRPVRSWPKLGGTAADGRRQQESDRSEQQGGHGHPVTRPTPTPMASRLEPNSQGTRVIADGSDVGGTQPPTHHTIYPTRDMPVDEFVTKYNDLPWEYGGRKR